MLYHFDATKTERFETTVANGETNVIKWLDSRGKETPYAASRWPTEFYGLVADYPSLVDVETRPGVTRKMVDLGYQMKGDGNKATGTPSVTNAAMLALNASVSGVRETFSIWADAYGRKDTSFFANADYTYLHVRGWNNNGRFFASSSYCGNWADGRIALDCSPGSIDSVMPAGVHLLSLCTKEGTSFSFGTWGNDRRYLAGGVQMGEQIGFSRALTTTERDLLERHLMAKWFSNTPLVLTNAYEEIDVAVGAKLTLRPLGEDDTVISVASLTGGGTLDADAVIASAVTTADLSAGTFSPFTVDGDLTFAPGATLTVSCSNPRTVAAGNYVLLEALSLTGSPSVDLSSFAKQRQVSSEILDNKIVLHVRRNGLCIVVR